ncbi:hypothetical protein L873DRAFT_1787440 [Choiromyces venosus 120613-1]|uniref:Uncharacterized protein n=1 Tax=Choiromyces venosus 120613-1 TaxID=1336337 RepID=A0A3N4JZL8_9PEZI|nr:hypothetical protein L873DRAFT_1787440 [Choiromyces venosus 120613-1]
MLANKFVLVTELYKSFVSPLLSGALFSVITIWQVNKRCEGVKNDNTRVVKETKKDSTYIEKGVDIINKRVNMVNDKMLMLTPEAIATRNNKEMHAPVARMGYCKLYEE